ncbi:hypothetical protein Pcinc_037276, partial [Petrolisthes cinctipes]
MAMSPLNVGSPSESLKRESPGASEGVVLSLRKHHVTTPLSLTTTNNTQVFSVIEGQIMQEVDDVCDDVVDDVVDDVTDDVDDEVRCKLGHSPGKTYSRVECEGREESAGAWGCSQMILPQ